jgi:hypothetical protein
VDRSTSDINTNAIQDELSELFICLDEGLKSSVYNIFFYLVVSKNKKLRTGPFPGRGGDSIALGVTLAIQVNMDCKASQEAAVPDFAECWATMDLLVLPQELLTG